MMDHSDLKYKLLKKPRSYSLVIAQRMCLRLFALKDTVQTTDILPEVRIILSLGVFAKFHNEYNQKDINYHGKKLHRFDITYPRSFTTQDKADNLPLITQAARSASQILRTNRNFYKYIETILSNTNEPFNLTSYLKRIGPAAKILTSPFPALSGVAITDIESIIQKRDIEQLLNSQIWLQGDLFFHTSNINFTDNPISLDNNIEWQFWRDWYQGFLDGKPLDWNLQREVALIPDADWEKGPAHIAGMIEEIRKSYNQNPSAEPSLEDQLKSVSTKAKSTISQNITFNRDALAVSIAGLNEQLTAFQEKVRGLNHLDPDFRVELLDYLKGLSDHLNNLLRDLPTTDNPISDKQAGKFVLWLREFKPLIAQKSRAYISPENVSEAAIPTGIILGCTGIGSMLGMPLAGAAVGGLITGQIKPGKAASDLFKSDKPDTGEE